MTVYTTAHSGVHFTPVNYLEGSPSVETVNMVRIRQVLQFLAIWERRTNFNCSYKHGTTSSVTSFAQSNQVCELDYQPQYGKLLASLKNHRSRSADQRQVDLWKYKGDVVIRKYPYDPNNPYYFTTLDIPL
jgi:primary-amine oxidase